MWPHMYVTYSLTHATAEATASHTPAPCRLSPADTNRGDSLELHNSSMIQTHLMLRICLSISTFDNAITLISTVYIIFIWKIFYCWHTRHQTEPPPPPGVLHRMHEAWSFWIPSCSDPPKINFYTGECFIAGCLVVGYIRSELKT